MSNNNISNFNNIKNKEMLWNILYEGGYFQNINNNKFIVIKTLFDRKIIEIEKTHTDKKLIELNKIAIRELIQIINNIKKQSINEQNQNNQNNQNKQIQQELITHDDIMNNRMNTFETNLREKENEMRKYLEKSQPSSINFSEEVVDKPIGENMDRILSEIITKRENDLKVVLQKEDIDKAAKWISSENTNTITNSNYETKAIKKLNISDTEIEISMDNNFTDISPKKNVSFGNNTYIKEHKKENMDRELTDVLDFLQNKTIDKDIDKTTNNTNNNEYEVTNILKEILDIVKDIQKKIK